MLAVRKIGRGIGHIEVQEVPEPQAGPEQVVVQVDSAGICGTDLHIYLKTRRRIRSLPGDPGVDLKSQEMDY